jgi:hypothetical protein
MSSALQPLMYGTPFTMADAHRAGLSTSAVRRMLGCGEVRHVIGDVYLDSGTQLSREIRLAALEKVVPPNCVACDETAAWVEGVDLFPEPDPIWVPPIHVFRTAGDDRLRRRGCATGKRELDLETDVTRLDRLMVTTKIRTACDLGRLRRRSDAYVALCMLARAGGFGRSELSAQLGRFKGMRGVIQLRDLVGIVETRVESHAEARVLLQIHDAGLPIPECQWVVRHQSGFELFRLDFAYPAIKLCIEYDGVAFHSTAEQVHRDRERRAYLRRHGWLVVVLRKEHVYGSCPQTAAIVRRAIDEATWALAG